MTRAVLALAFALALAAPPSSTARLAGAHGDAAPPTTEERAQAESLMERAAARNDWTEALRVVRVFLAAHPKDALMLYNGACIRCRLDDVDGAVADLGASIDAGFGDLGAAAGDPDLAPLRADPRWPKLRERLAAKMPAAARRTETAKQAFESWRTKYGEKRYRYEVDEERRLLLATALEETSRAEMLAMLHRQGDWLVRELFGGVQNDPVLVAIPHPLDFKDHFPDATTAGVYEHRNRVLVSRDTGASLRHEFVHLLHWGHMDRLRQVHPIWLQEGLASLFEDYEWREDGSPSFRPNIRHNLARGAATHGNAPPWSRFFTMNNPQFMAKAELHYAVARSIFEFLADRGRLKEWYAAYTRGFDEDPGGLGAMSEAFGRPAEEVEKEWRRWVAGRGPIKDQVSPEDPILGVQAVNSNDGVKVTRVLRRTPAANAGLRVADVIVKVNDETIRSLEELVIALGRRASDQPVTIGYRRKGEYRTATLAPATGRPALAP